MLREEKYKTEFFYILQTLGKSTKHLHKKDKSMPEIWDDTVEYLSRKFQERLDKALKNGYPIDYAPDDVKTSLLSAILLYYDTSMLFNQPTVIEHNIVPKLIKILIDRGASVDAVDPYNGWSPLMYATYHNTDSSKNILSLLLPYAHELENVNEDGNTALDLLCDRYIYGEQITPKGQAKAQANILENIQLFLDYGAQYHYEKYANLQSYDEQIQRAEELNKFVANYTQQKEQLARDYKDKISLYDYEL